MHKKVESVKLFYCLLGFNAESVIYLSLRLNLLTFNSQTYYNNQLCEERKYFFYFLIFYILSHDFDFI